ncbi:MAG: hypothetical protein ABJE95_10255 [Byssovorax sp.]
MTVDEPPSAHDFARSLVRTSIALFVASPLTLVLGALLLASAGRLSRAFAVSHMTEDVVVGVVATIAVAPLHLNLLSPLLAKWFIGARARRLLPAGSILVVSDDNHTWRLFARATVVTAAGLMVLLLWKAGQLGDSLGGIVLAMVLSNALWLYRVVGITVLWFRHAHALDESVAVLARADSGYREPARLFLQLGAWRREVVIERVDGARVELKDLDAARLAGRSDAFAGRIEGVQEVWRAAGPRGAEAVAAWLGRS